MSHSYEEIRAAALDVLSKREPSSHEPTQYGHISIGVAEVFARREGGPQRSRLDTHLRGEDAETFLEVFWDLFRQGIITLGYNDSNRDFPNCRLSRLGKKLAANQDTYFFHDIEGYSRVLGQQVPDLDSVTLLYVKEAMQALRAGCLLSATVMLGVATEHTFNLVVEAILASPAHGRTFAAVAKERSILPKANKFKALLDANLGILTTEIREDLDTRFAGILSVIRSFRNQSGHPTGQLIDREQVYVLLQLFPSYCHKMYQLKDHLSK